MKSASIPALRVESALRQAAEDVLRDGETARAHIARCMVHPHRSGDYFDAAHAELDEMLKTEKAAKATR